MKRKLLFLLILFFLIMPLNIIFVACDAGGGTPEPVDPRIQLTRNRIQYSGGTCYYTGQEQTLDLDRLTIQCNGNKVANVFFTFEYRNNINVGTAVLIITCKDSNPTFKGTCEFSFNIAASTTTVSTLQDLKDKINNTNYRGVTLNTSLTIERDDSLTISESPILIISDGAKLINNGTITINGSTFVRSGCQIINNGTIINNANLEIARNGVFYAGTYNGSGTVSNEGTVYSDGVRISNLTNNESGRDYVREDLANATITLENMTDGKVEYIYNTSKFTTTIYVNGVVFEDGQYDFGNYTMPTSNAVLTLQADYDNYKSQKFCGTREFTYEIVKGIAQISSYSELISAQASGRYDRFNGATNSQITITAGNTFTLADDEQLNVGTIYVNGTLINNGAITLTTRLENRNVITNNGDIQTPLLDCALGTTFTNGQDATLIMSNSFILKGNFTNNGTTTTAGLTYNSYNDNGSMSIVNAGTLAINGNFTAHKLNINNSGTITHSGTSYLYTEYSTFTNTGTFTNNGTIYGYSDNILTGVNGVVYRKYLTTDHNEYSDNTDKYAYVALDENEFFYSGDNNIPNIIVTSVTSGTESSFTLYPKINGNTTEIMYLYNNDSFTGSRRTDYSLAITYTNADLPYAGDGLLASAGSLQVKFKSADNNIEFVTKPEDRVTRLVLEYTVERVQKTINSSSVLISMLTDGTGTLYQGNYYAMTLSQNITLTMYSNTKLIIQPHCTLYLGSHILTYQNRSSGANAYIENNGKIEGTGSSILCLSPYGSSDTKTLISNSGEIVDVGKIMLEPVYTRLINYTDNGIKKVNNTQNTKIYNFNSVEYTSATLFWGFHDTTDTIGTNTGVDIYTRTSLNKLRDDGVLTLQYSSTPYDGNMKTPAVYLNGALIDITVFSTPQYTNNLNASHADLASVSLGVIDEYNTLYVGSTTLTFAIEQIEQTIIGLNQSMINSGNYSKLILTQNITLSENVSLGNYPIVIDMGTYDFVNSGSNNYRVTCTSTSEIWVSVNSADRYGKYGAVADKITFVNNITDTSLQYIRMRYDYASFGNANDPNKIFNYAHYNTLTIDYNGYNFAGQTNVSFQAEDSEQVFTLILTSSGSRSALGTAGANNYSLIISNPMSAGVYNITMSNLTVYGCSAPYNPSYSGITISANDTVFDASGNTDNNYGYGFRLWGSPTIYGFQNATTITNGTKLTVRINSASSVKNKAGWSDGIYIQHS